MKTIFIFISALLIFQGVTFSTAMGYSTAVIIASSAANISANNARRKREAEFNKWCQEQEQSVCEKARAEKQAQEDEAGKVALLLLGIILVVCIILFMTII